MGPKDEPCVLQVRIISGKGFKNVYFCVLASIPQIASYQSKISLGNQIVFPSFLIA